MIHQIGWDEPPATAAARRLVVHVHLGEVQEAAAVAAINGLATRLLELARREALDAPSDLKSR